MPAPSVGAPINSLPEYGICRETGLPEKPPAEHSDGTIRYRICKRCRECKPLKSFGRIIRRLDTRFGDRGIYRRRTCTACHDSRKGKRKQQIERRRGIKAISKAAAEIRCSANVNTIMGIVDRVACDVGGDLERFCERWVSLINDPLTSHRLKISSMQTFVHVLAVAEANQLGDQRFENIDPAEYLKWLANRKLLGGLFCAALDEGWLTLDDIDPPPYDSDWPRD